MAIVLAPPLVRANTWRTAARVAVRYTQSALVVALVALALYVAQLALLGAESPYQSVLINAREAGFLLSGVHGAEQDQRSAFRWSDGDTAISWYPRAIREATVLSLLLGPPPPELVGTPLQVSAGGSTIARWMVDARPRRYHILLPAPPAVSPRVAIGLASAAVTIPPDERPLSMRIEAVGLHSVGGMAWPAPGAALIQTLALLLGGGLMSVLLTRSWANLGVAVLGLALGMAFAAQPLLYTPFVLRLAIALAVLLAGTHVALPPFVRALAWAGPAGFARAIWAAAMLACAVRLIGSLYPLFHAYDLALNLGRFESVAQGSLVAFNESFEFGGGMTVYPAGAYLVLLVGLLTGLAPALIVQIGIALIDGLSVVLVALLARRLGVNQRASVFAALLAAAMPISLTSLYYGHTAQIFGQVLMAPLALLLMGALAQPKRVAYWAGAAIVLNVALLTHIGVAVLVSAWMGLVWLALAARWRAHRGAWRRFTLMLAASIGMSMLLVYAPVVKMHLEQLSGIGTAAMRAERLPAYNLIAKAYWIAYAPLGMLLFGPGAALLARRLPPEARLLTWCWGVAAAVFAAIELFSGLQVRFLVFLAPLAAIAAGAVLGSVASRGRWGRLAALAAIALLFVQSGLVWYSGTFLNIAPSMVPLLR